MFGPVMHNSPTNDVGRSKGSLLSVCASVRPLCYSHVLVYAILQVNLISLPYCMTTITITINTLKADNTTANRQVWNQDNNNMDHLDFNIYEVYI